MANKCKYPKIKKNKAVYTISCHHSALEFGIVVVCPTYFPHKPALSNVNIYLSVLTLQLSIALTHL